MSDKKAEFKDKKNEKTNKPFIKWLAISLIALFLFVGFNYLKVRKLRSQRMDEMEEQRQVLIESWRNQGLTEEEIEEKLATMRQNGLPVNQRSESGIGIMRAVTGGRGMGRK